MLKERKEKKKNSLPSNIIKTDNTSEIVSLKRNDVGERDLRWQKLTLCRAHLECALDCIEKRNLFGPDRTSFTDFFFPPHCICVAETSRPFRLIQHAAKLQGECCKVAQ